MQRFFIKNFSKKSLFILEDSGLIHQISHVFRARVWDMYAFFDGISLQDYLYQIEKIEKKSIEFRFLEEKEKEKFPKTNIHLYQALPNKISKIEYILQKWVELGITSFSFFVSERSQKLLLSENKNKRFEKIIIEALEQCDGNILPSIWFYDTIQFPLQAKKTIFFHHEIWENSLALKDIDFKGREDINIIIWPEGGLSDKEVALFEQHNFIKCYFWNRILRTETVAPVVAFYIGQQE